MAYCLLENVSIDEKQNKMYIINTVNAACEIYMLAKCQQIDDWFSENWEEFVSSYCVLHKVIYIILNLSTCDLATQNYNYFFLVILKGTGRKLKRKKKIGNQTIADTCYIFNNQQMTPEHFSDPQSAFSCISRCLKGATVSKFKVWMWCTMIKIGSLNLPHKLRFLIKIMFLNIFWKAMGLSHVYIFLANEKHSQSSV